MHHIRRPATSRSRCGIWRSGDKLVDRPALSNCVACKTDLHNAREGIGQKRPHPFTRGKR